MRTPVNFRDSYRFGLFEADPTSGELLRQGVRVRIQDLPFRLLIILLEHAGEVVSREELRARLWPADTFVEFDGSLKTALKRLRSALGESAENPVFIETLPKRGYRFVAPVTRPALIEGYEKQSQTAATRSLGTDQVPSLSAPDHSSPTLGTSRRVYGLTLAGVLLCVVLVGLGWYSLRHRLHSVTGTATVTVPPIAVRKSVAVLGFHNASGHPHDDWLSTAISQMLSTELATGEKLRVVSGEEVANLRVSSPWSETSTLGRETTSRIGAALNSDVLILGSYTAIGAADHQQLRFDVRLQDARTGEVLGQIARTGNGNDLFHVASEISARLRQQLGVPEIKDTEQAGVLASLPLDRDGARLYALGVDKLRDFDALAAKDLLEQATNADPKFPLAHLMLARAWSQLGYEQKRKEEAKKALDLSLDLPRMERMQVEGDYYESIPNHEKAASAYRALFELFPDNVEYGLQLGEAQKAAGHGAETMETVGHLRDLPRPASDDPRIDILEAKTSTATPVRLALVRNAQHKAMAQGKKLVYAKARRDECMYLNASEHTDQALPACEDAYNLFMAAGNRLEAADTIRLTGNVEAALAQHQLAFATFQRALKMLQELGEHEKTGAVLTSMAIILANEEKLDRAEELYRKARLHFEQAGDKERAGTAMADLGDVLYLRGNLPAARKSYEEAIAINASLDDSKPGYVEYRMSDLELTLGHVQSAHRLVQEALDGLRPVQGDYNNLTEALIQMGEVLRAEGDLAGARKQFETARDAELKAGDVGLVEESQSELADVDLEEGHPDEAEPLTRAAIVEFEKEESAPAMAASYAQLSQVLLAQGKFDEARKAIQHSLEINRNSTDPALNLPIALVAARLDLAAVSQNPPGHLNLGTVRQELRSIVDTAKRLGYYSQECDARLALGELEVKANPAVGRSMLTQLAAEAHQHGLELISRKATVLAGGTKGTAMAAAPSPSH
jgi:DNA-binding winged helix-turn-helix (wHTH) protein/tetratricopeptide (TPR) repeat protein